MLKELNIVVLLKQVPVPKAMRTKADGMLDRSGKSMINPYCNHALEEALKLREQTGGIITILSMGPPNVEQSLIEAMRKGADKATLISDRMLAGSDSWATALTLSVTLKKKLPETDIVFAGLQTIDGDTAHIGPQIAEHIGFNQVTYVDKIEIKEETLKVRRQIEAGWMTIETSLPVVLSVTSTANTPRGPSLYASLKTSEKNISVYGIKDLGLHRDEVGLAGSPTIVSKVQNVNIDRSEIKLYDGDDISSRVSKMLEEFNENLSKEVLK